ncbi:Chloride conductance regulatory protein ICln [Hondaea fermentalgiana]|uniref:Chloride conductance regulatory protein ICln n=1 Tax=Hondaea fermentalgiana TaxID=2315210 RepID=A0A2R5G9X4_9STRA|nr:Chloride conductance regulatory protein ICln [Hondaea fermentalgiana]|eukprot:GBG25343.1 Chloride conductance regulatory protein ICln [Hondaea fermentalgiana]
MVALDALLVALSRDDALFKAAALTDATAAETLAVLGDEVVFVREPSTLLVVNDGTEDEDENAAAQSTRPRGTLFVTSARVAWVSDAAGAAGSDHADANADAQGVQIDYRTLNMHAVCKEDSVVQQPCMYCQLMAAPSEDSCADFDDGEEEDQDMIEVRFVPENEDSLSQLFQAFSRGAALFPDDEDLEEVEEEEEEDTEAREWGENDETGNLVEDGIQIMNGEALGAGGGGEWITFENTEGLSAGEAEALQAKLAHWDSLLVEPGQFDDAAEPEAAPPSGGDSS